MAYLWPILKVERRRVLQLSVLVVSCVLISSCSNLKNFKKTISGLFKNKGETKSSEETKNETSQVWSYFPIKKATLSDSVQLEGKLEASEKVEMRADKSLRVGPAKFKVGDQIHKRDVLFEVDTKELDQKRVTAGERVAQLKVDIKSSNAQFEFAQKQLVRKKGLASKGIATQKDLEEAQKLFVSAESDMKTKELEYRKAERELSSASEAMATANITSPIDGIVSSIAPGGDNVSQGQSFATIANPTRLSIMVAADETMVTKFKLGQKVRVELDALPEQAIEGEVKSIESRQQGAPQTNTLNMYDITVGVSQNLVKSLKLRDGYKGQVKASFSERSNVLVVPRAGLRQEAKDWFLMVATARGSQPAARAIKIGSMNDLEAEIKDGVSEGEWVAIATATGEQHP